MVLCSSPFISYALLSEKSAEDLSASILLLGVFSAAFQDPESVEVRLAAFKGAIAFLCDASAALRKSSDDFVASMLNVGSV